MNGEKVKEINNMLKFSYISKKFQKRKTVPLSENEYKILKEDFYGFLDVAKERNLIDSKNLLNDAYSFNHRIILIITLIFACGISFLLKKIYPYDLTFRMIYYIFLLIFSISILTNLIYTISYLMSIFTLMNYRKKFSKYYSYHYKNLCNTNSYQGYLEKLKLKKTLL